MTVCVACGADIPERLYEFGDAQNPMCQSCHLTLLDEPQPEGLFYYTPILDDQGIEIGRMKHLTVEGVVFFECGRPGDVVLAYYYGDPKRFGAVEPTPLNITPPSP